MWVRFSDELNLTHGEMEGGYGEGNVAFQWELSRSTKAIAESCGGQCGIRIVSAPIQVEAIAVQFALGASAFGTGRIFGSKGFPPVTLAEVRAKALHLGLRHGNTTTKEQIPLDKAKAKQMLETAREHVGENVFIPKNFDEVDLRAFLEQYLWVIYVSGFRNAVVEKHFDGLKAAFHDLDLDRIVAMESIDARTLPIRYQRKADAFLKGCRLIHDVGWPAAKERLRERGRAAFAGASLHGVCNESTHGASPRHRRH